MTQDPSPHEALASIQAARSGLAPPKTYPAGYDLAYGLVCGLLVMGPGLPTPWSMLVLVLALSGLAGLIMWWRRTQRWWVSGYSPRRARWVAIGMATLFILLIGLSIYGRRVGPEWLLLVSGGLGFVSAIVGSRVWMRVWRRELAESAG